MNNLDQIQKGIDYIETHLHEDLTLMSVAKEAGLSLWHFQRVFSALTGEGIKKYIRSRRLAHACTALTSSDERIIDIAINCGFESQESFSRAFKKSFDITPAKYRELRDAEKGLSKIKIDQAYLIHLNKGVSMKPELKNVNEMKLVGLQTTFFGINSDDYNAMDKLPPVWGAFMQQMGNIKNRTNPFECYGVVDCIEDGKWEYEELEYSCMVEVSTFEDIPDGMVTKTVARSQYASFTHQGKLDDVNKTIHYIYGTWLPGSDMKRIPGPELEVYGKEFDPTSDKSILYYMIPVK